MNVILEQEAYGHNGLTTLHRKINNHIIYCFFFRRVAKIMRMCNQMCKHGVLPSSELINGCFLTAGKTVVFWRYWRVQCRSGAGTQGPTGQRVAQGCPSRLFAAEATGNLRCECSEMDYMAPGSLRQSSCPSHSKWM